MRPTLLATGLAAVAIAVVAAFTLLPGSGGVIAAGDPGVSKAEIGPPGHLVSAEAVDDQRHPLDQAPKEVPAPVRTDPPFALDLFGARTSPLELPSKLPDLELLLANPEIPWPREGDEFLALTEEVKELVQTENAKTEALVKKANLAMHRWIGDKVSYGEGELLGPDAEVGPEPGCAVAIHVDSTGREHLVRVWPGESALVDVAYDDAWFQAVSAQEMLIKALQGEGQ